MLPVQDEEAPQGETFAAGILRPWRRVRQEQKGERPRSECGLQNEEDVMSVLSWIILGLISGFLASKIVNKTGEGIVLDIVLGIVGAVVGGWLFQEFGHMGVTGLNLYSVLVSVAGAIVVLVLYHAIRGRR
jgi:uncharacterized membrane protein YeaQ/YmgE (transglycosylase-associated protein family)